LDRENDGGGSEQDDDDEVNPAHGSRPRGANWKVPEPIACLPAREALASNAQNRPSGSALTIRDQHGKIEIIAGAGAMADSDDSP
jgi:hypothetical protein